ncbi:MAG: 3-oxoacyl-ACP synthase III [Candidatus Sericytochromatia bacterium]|nr:3-oxoacyl-ACP synthase III [Candidatus Sericytochromatia bacterium]
MRYTRVHLAGLGYELPQEEVTSEALEARLAPLYESLRVAPGQLAYLTGIHSRRWWPEGQRLAPMAAKAGLQALQRAELSPGELGAVVYGSVCRDDFEPASACEVAHLIGAGGAVAVLDVANACLGMLSGVLHVANMIELGQIRAGLVVGCESAREINEAMIAEMLLERNMGHFMKAMATLTGGSAAAAIVLTDGTVGAPPGPRLAGGIQWAAPQHHDLCRWGLDRRRPARQAMVMETDAVPIMREGVPLGRDTWQRLLQELNWPAPDRTISHQVGQANRAAILQAIGMPLERDFVTYTQLGNTGSTAVPVTAAMAAEQGFTQAGMRVAWLGIGSGLNCLMLGWEG